MTPSIEIAIREIYESNTIEELGKKYDSLCNRFLSCPFEIYVKLVDARDRRMEQLKKIN